MSEKKTLQLWHDHGMGDCVHFATVLQLYRRRGYDITVHFEHNKRHVFEAAGIGYHPTPENYNHWRYYDGFNQPTAECDWSGNKTALNLNLDGLPDLGDRGELWDELCSINLEDSFDPHLTPEIKAEVAGWLEHLPRPIVLLHPRGSNFWVEKSIPEGTTRELYRLLLDGMPGSVIVLDWDNPVPFVPHGRMRYLKRDFGHLDILQTVALMNEAALLIGVDSGPFHLANTMTRLPCLQVNHHFYPSCIGLPSPTLKTAVMTRSGDSYRPINRTRRKRWSILEYPGDMPSAAEIARHALRMLEGPRYGCPIGRDVMIQQMVRDWLRASTSTSEIADRNNTMDFLLREMTRRFDDPVVVETGTTRMVDDWTAGVSTYVFGAWMDGRKAGKLVSVDINPTNCATAKALCRPWGERVEVVESCSVKYLEGRKEPVDVLYLDSMDCEEPGHQEHGLWEAEAGARLVRDDGLIVYDDTVWSGGQWVGKGALGVPYLLENGWKVATGGYQTVLTRRV